MKSFIYKHIHPCRWMKITLNFNYKLKAPSSSFMLMRKPSSHEAHLAQVFPQRGMSPPLCPHTMCHYTPSLININHLNHAFTIMLRILLWWNYYHFIDFFYQANNCCILLNKGVCHHLKGIWNLQKFLITKLSLLNNFYNMLVALFIVQVEHSNVEDVVML